MRIDLPCCPFKNCKHCFDGNCKSKIEYERCEFMQILKILGDDYDLSRMRELVKADREGRVKILAPAMLATCGSCTSFRRTPGTASGICEKREQFKVFQKRPCCKMYKAREDCE